MNIDKVNTVKFEAGNVHLKRVCTEKIPSYEAIKKIAEDKGMDIFISKNKESKYFPKEDMFLVLAFKEQPVIARNFFRVGTKSSHAANCVIVNKDVKNEELGVRVYNATMNAIESLEGKLGINKNRR